MGLPGGRRCGDEGVGLGKFLTWSVPDGNKKSNVGLQACCSDGHVDCTARISMAPTPRHPHHQEAACTDATGHPRRGHHRTTSYTSCSVRSPGRCSPHRLVRHPDTTAPSPRSHFPFLPSTRHTPRRHSTRLGLFAGKCVKDFSDYRLVNQTLGP